MHRVWTYERGPRLAFGEVIEAKSVRGGCGGTWRATKRCCASASFEFSSCTVSDWRVATSDWCSDDIPEWNAAKRSCNAPLAAPRDAHSWAKRSLLRISSDNWDSARDNLYRESVVQYIYAIYILFLKQDARYRIILKIVG